MSVTTDGGEAASRQFFVGQLVVRKDNREKFKSDAGAFLFAHSAAVGALADVHRRFTGRKFSPELPAQTARHTSEASQLGAMFMQGIDPCETMIAEGLYGQAAALVRQHLELVGGMSLARQGKPRQKPQHGVRLDLKSFYGNLSQAAHGVDPDLLGALFTASNGDLVGSSLIPLYRRDTALLLYWLELQLLFEFAIALHDTLVAAYGGGLSDTEGGLLKQAVVACNLGVGDNPDLFVAKA